MTKLELNDYQAANLLWLLELIHDGYFDGDGINTGDWVGELRFQLEDKFDKSKHQPNISKEQWIKDQYGE